MPASPKILKDIPMEDNTPPPQIETSTVYYWVLLKGMSVTWMVYRENKIGEPLTNCYLFLYTQSVKKLRKKSQLSIQFC